jgi:hypothetical protein
MNNIALSPNTVDTLLDYMTRSPGGEFLKRGAFLKEIQPFMKEWKLVFRLWDGITLKVLEARQFGPNNPIKDMSSILSTSKSLNALRSMLSNDNWIDPGCVIIPNSGPGFEPIEVLKCAIQQGMDEDGYIQEIVDELSSQEEVILVPADRPLTKSTVDDVVAITTPGPKGETRASGDIQMIKRNTGHKRSW